MPAAAYDLVVDADAEDPAVGMVVGAVVVGMFAVAVGEEGTGVDFAVVGVRHLRGCIVRGSIPHLRDVGVEIGGSLVDEERRWGWSRTGC